MEVFSGMEGKWRVLVTLTPLGTLALLALGIAFLLTPLLGLAAPGIWLLGRF